MKKCAALASVALCALVAMTGCQSINTSDAGNMTVNPQTSGPIDRYRPLYKVDEAKTVTGNAKIHCLFGLFVWGGKGSADYADFTNQDDSFLAKLLPNPKATGAKSAFYDACVANKCDSLVASRYTIKTTDYIVYTQYDITVKGYPAVQTGIETIKPVPYYIDFSTGKVVILEKFVDMINVGYEPCGVNDPSPGVKGWFIF